MASTSWHPGSTTGRTSATTSPPPARSGRRSARPTGYPLVRERRAAAVGARGRGHGLLCRRPPPHRRHADPPRPHRSTPSPPAEDVELAAAEGRDGAGQTAAP